LFLYEGNLVATGNLIAAGNLSVNRAAQWDGFRWNNFLVDTGKSYFASSKGLLVVQQYTRADGALSDRVMCWDGARWTQLGGDLDGSKFIEYEGELFAARNGGSVFKLVNGNWQRVPTMGSSVFNDFSIRAFCVFHGDLYAGGDFYLGKYDGTRFNPLLSDQWVGIADIQEHQGYLVAAGSFSEIDGVPALNIARWNGTTWTSLGLGLGGGWPGYGQVNRLGIYQGDLVAIGWFQQAGGQSNALIARWNGTRWFSVGPQRGPFRSRRFYDTQLFAMAVRGDSLLVAGSFSQVAGEVAEGVALWNGSHWGPLVSDTGFGLNGPVNASTMYDGMLIVGGGFSEAGSLHVNDVAAWNGKEWQDLGGGVDDDVEALTVWDNKLIATGYFHHAGGQAAQRIAAWDGLKWMPLGAGMEYGVMGMTPYEGSLVAVGYFSQAGGVPASRVASWDGSEWHPLGTGIDPGSVGQAVATSALVYSGDLIVGGSFSRVGGVEAHNIARWDGSSWHPLGSGTDAGVAALAEWNGLLIASGAFSKAGGKDVTSIATWDGQDWHAMGHELRDGTVRPYIKCMTLYNGSLVVGGRFREAGGIKASGMALWTGTEWTPFGKDPFDALWSFDSPYVNCITSYQGDLYPGGIFMRAQDRPSAFIARWQIPKTRSDRIPPLRPFAGAEPNGLVTIRFNLAREGQVSMDVFDLNGRRIVNLGAMSFSSGEHEFSWSGRDSLGRRLPQGIYFARLNLPTGPETHRILIRR